MIKAILFDMDGVLVEAKEWHYEAFNKALQLFGLRISRPDHLRNFDGLPTRKKLEMLTQAGKVSDALHDFISEMKQCYTLELVHARCHPDPLHEYTLSSLKTQGYKLAVCSNAVRDTVHLMMQKAALAPYLDLMISNEDVSHSKPHPEMYIKAMQHFGLQPHECLILEDNEKGIQAAQAAGGQLLVIQEVQETNLSNILGRINTLNCTPLTA